MARRSDTPPSTLAPAVAQPSTPPAEVVSAVAAETEVGEAETEERRRFPVAFAVLLGDELFTPDGEDQPNLTRAEFDQLKAGRAVLGDWSD